MNGAAIGVVIGQREELFKLRCCSPALLSELSRPTRRSHIFRHVSCISFVLLCHSRHRTRAQSQSREHSGSRRNGVKEGITSVQYERTTPFVLYIATQRLPRRNWGTQSQCLGCYNMAHVVRHSLTQRNVSTVRTSGPTIALAMPDQVSSAEGNGPTRLPLIVPMESSRHHGVSRPHGVLAHHASCESL